MKSPSKAQSGKPKAAHPAKSAKARTPQILAQAGGTAVVPGIPLPTKTQGAASGAAGSKTGAKTGAAAGKAGAGTGTAAGKPGAAHGGNGVDDSHGKPYKPSPWSKPLDDKLPAVISLGGKLDDAMVGRIRERVGKERDPFLVRKHVVDTLLSSEAQQEYLREVKAVIAANGGAGHIEQNRHLPSALLYEALRETVHKK